MTWEALRNACLACTQCPLCQTRHNVVFGVGPEDAEVLFIGEGPGEQEDLKGEPFVGPAGRLLDEMLTIIDLSRETCYIANIVKCRPPHNRDPLPVEQEACIGWLRAQTKLLRPKIIVCLGRIAASGRRKAGSGSRRSITPPRCCATRASGPMRSAISRAYRPRYASFAATAFYRNNRIQQTSLTRCVRDVLRLELGTQPVMIRRAPM